MIYREKKIYSGKMLEVEIFPITLQERKQSRRKKEKESEKKQKNLNDKNARKHLVRLLNANFKDKDLAVHLTYNNNNLPENEEEARRDVKNFIRRVKRYRKKHQMNELKYVAVIEYKEKTAKNKEVRMHHHLVMSGMDRDIIEGLWGKGIANADRLKSDEFGYEALGRYISKDPKGNRRWTQSRNLKQPVVKVNDFKFSKKKVENLSKNPEDRELFEKLYPKYYFTSCKSTVNEVYGDTYVYIKLRKIKD